jgi:hypothetical protein
VTRLAKRPRIVLLRKAMAMPVALPERTVDAWVTAYVVERVPGALLWAPTQRQIPDYDLATSLPGPGKLFVFENKAPQTAKAYHFILSVRQLWNYLRRADLRARTFYVLPCPPNVLRPSVPSLSYQRSAWRPGCGHSTSGGPCSASSTEPAQRSSVGTPRRVRGVVQSGACNRAVEAPHTWNSA